jgi:hypothetical protein
MLPSVTYTDQLKGRFIDRQGSRLLSSSDRRLLDRVRARAEGRSPRWLAREATIAKNTAARILAGDYPSRITEEVRSLLTRYLQADSVSDAVSDVSRTTAPSEDLASELRRIYELPLDEPQRTWRIEALAAAYRAAALNRESIAAEYRARAAVGESEGASERARAAAAAEGSALARALTARGGAPPELLAAAREFVELVTSQPKPDRQKPAQPARKRDPA